LEGWPGIWEYLRLICDDQRRLADLLDRSLDQAWIDVPEITQR